MTLKRRTPLKRSTVPLKRTPLKRSKIALKRTKLRVVGVSDTSVLKREIQALLRAIVMIRDGGCALRHVRPCGGEIGEAVLQADHLITRGNTATYADSRLVVCLCRPCHGGFKKWHKEEYDKLVKTIISKERVALWSRCETESWQPKRKIAQDWKLDVVQLEHRP